MSEPFPHFSTGDWLHYCLFANAYQQQIYHNLYQLEPGRVYRYVGGLQNPSKILATESSKGFLGFWGDKILSYRDQSKFRVIKNDGSQVEILLYHPTLKEFWGKPETIDINKQLSHHFGMDLFQEIS